MFAPVQTVTSFKIWANGSGVMVMEVVVGPAHPLLGVKVTSTMPDEDKG